MSEKLFLSLKETPWKLPLNFRLTQAKANLLLKNSIDPVVQSLGTDYLKPWINRKFKRNFQAAFL